MPETNNEMKPLNRLAMRANMVSLPRSLAARARLATENKGRGPQCKWLIRKTRKTGNSEFPDVTKWPDVARRLYAVVHSLRLRRTHERIVFDHGACLLAAARRSIAAVGVPALHGDRQSAPVR